jgi:hypothetical protein
MHAEGRMSIRVCMKLCVGEREREVNIVWPAPATGASRKTQLLHTYIPEP